AHLVCSLGGPPPTATYTLSLHDALPILSQPRVVEEVHLAYIAAGADLIETNTFGANPFRLRAYGLEEEVWRVNLQGAKLARRLTDRKSTRLNSSHVKISYAVFCLKKKKK